MEKRCAAYLRVSTHDQEEYSPDSQLRLIRDYAEKNGMTLPGQFVFRDDGVSGRSAEKRPGFQRMIAQARRKPRPFDCILVWKFSRFARNQEESVVYKSLLKKEAGVEVVSVSEPLMEGPFGGLIERVIEWFDAFYSANLSVEVRRGMEERFSRGLAVSGAPLGYVYQKGRLAVAEEEAETVRLIFREFLSGVPVAGIARRLNLLGIRTKRGGPWEDRAVRYVLENPVYLGKLRTRRGADGEDSFRIVPGEHPALLTQQEFEDAQKRLEKRCVRKTGRNVEKAGESLLRGVVKCGNCGGTLVRTGKGLNCSRYAHGRCGKSHYIRAEKLESLVTAALKEQLGGLSYTPRQTTREPEQEAALLRRMLKNEREGLARSREAYAAGVDTLAEYRENKAAATARIAALERSLSACRGEMDCREEVTPRDALQRLAAEDGSPEEKHGVLAALLDRIVFHKETRTLELVFASGGEEESSE